MGADKGATAATAAAAASLAHSTAALCRALRSYRKKLAGAPSAAAAAALPADALREVERELGLTARAVGERGRSSRAVDEGVMVRLLSQYSERLIEMLGDRISVPEAVSAREAMGCLSTVKTPLQLPVLKLPAPSVYAAAITY